MHLVLVDHDGSAAEMLAECPGALGRDSCSIVDRLGRVGTRCEAGYVGAGIAAVLFEGYALVESC